MSGSVNTLQTKAVAQAALAADKIVLAAPGVIYGLSGYNSKASAQFIQIHDSATTPADTAVPIFDGTVAASANYNFDFGIHGLTCVNGIYTCNSSTAPAKTIGSADTQFFARVLPV